MDEIGLIKGLTADPDLPDAADEGARARARLALLEQADPHASRPTARRSPRRRLLAFGGAGALATIVAGILVLSSGPSAEPAAAEVLHETSEVAAASDSRTEAQPGPDQFLYSKTKSVGWDGWIPDPPPSHGRASNAMIERSSETWISPKGSFRTREVMGSVEFLASAEQQHWEQAGRPLPRGAFDPSDQDLIDHIAEEGGKVLEMGRGLLDVEYPTPREGRRPSFGFFDVSGLPTEPAEFRRAVQSHRIPALSLNVVSDKSKPLGREETIAAIWGFLSLPTTTPALRATAFNALAELPGIELKRDATDLIGRNGSAIGYDEPVGGMRIEYIFDPETSEILGRRNLLIDPEKFAPGKGLPKGLTIDEIVYLQSGVVDSTDETVEERNGGPVATTGPIYRR